MKEHSFKIGKNCAAEELIYAEHDKAKPNRRVRAFFPEIKQSWNNESVQYFTTRYYTLYHNSNGKK